VRRLPAVIFFAVWAVFLSSGVFAYLSGLAQFLVPDLYEVNVRSTPDGGSAVQPSGLSYTAHWEALGCAHGPVAGSGLLPRLPPPTCSRPVSGVGLGLFVYSASLPRSPGPCFPTVFRSAICDGLSINGCFLLLFIHHFSCTPTQKLTLVAWVLSWARVPTSCVVRSLPASSLSSRSSP
jgi:hypothetical protein